MANRLRLSCVGWVVVIVLLLILCLERVLSSRNRDTGTYFSAKLRAGNESILRIRGRLLSNPALEHTQSNIVDISQIADVLDVMLGNAQLIDPRYCKDRSPLCELWVDSDQGARWHIVVHWPGKGALLFSDNVTQVCFSRRSERYHAFDGNDNYLDEGSALCSLISAIIRHDLKFRELTERDLRASVGLKP
jgi:hypothetical protein